MTPEDESVPVRRKRTSDDGIGHNDAALLAFNNWLSAQPELAGSGYVHGVNDHSKRSTILWWAGPTTAFQQRVLQEARVRGISASIHVAKYGKEARRAAAELIFDASQAFEAVGFELTVISAGSPEHDGLIVHGREPSRPNGPLSESTRTAVRAVLTDIVGLPDVVDLSDIRVEYGEMPVPL